MSDLLPVEAVPRFGGEEMDELGRLLGGALGGLGGSALSDPRIQQALREAVGKTCQTKAKEGIVAAARENQGTILLWVVGTVGVLLLGHFVLSVAALNLAFPRQAFREIRQQLA